MTKKESTYSNIPTAEPAVEEFTVGSSQVTVIVDENASPYNTAPESTNPRFLLLGSRRPVNLSQCPKCAKAHVRTSTRTYPSAVTWVGVVVSAFICLPLCWVPLLVDPLKQTDHFCQSCGQKIGTIKALEGCCVKEMA